MASKVVRPYPDEELLDKLDWFEPALDAAQWIYDTIIKPTGQIHNPDHLHLLQAEIGVLWTSAHYAKTGRTVIGQAEIPMFRCGRWQKARQEQQMLEWFGAIPDFVITLSAGYCIGASETEFAALVEHELYHCGQAKDEFGAPRFNKETGRPSFTIRGHDVEEFVGVVRRYGAGNPEGSTAQLVKAANRPPEVALVNIQRACGTCLLKSA